MEKPNPVSTDSPAHSSAPPRLSPPLRSKLIALALSLVLALAVGEVFVRVIFPDEVNTRLLRERDWLFWMAGMVEPSSDPGLLYELRRDLSMEWKGIIVATDETEPVRISTFIPPARDAPIRIALIGDSGAFGWGVEYENSYCEILRQKLEDTLGVEVDLRNYAVPGYNTFQERILLERDVLGWRPDLLILHYDHNDPEPKAGNATENITPEYGDNALHSALWKFALRRIRVARIKQSFQFGGKDEVAESNRVGEWLYRGSLWEDHLAELGRIGQLAADNGIPALAFLWCYSVERRGSGWNDEHLERVHQPLTAALEEAGFHVLDTYPRFRALMEAQGWENLEQFRIAPFDAHPNRACHALLADYLADFIVGEPGLIDPLRESARGVAPRPRVGSSNRIGDRFRHACQLTRSGKFEEAEALLRQLMLEEPENFTFQASLIDVLLARDKPGQAEQELERIAAIKPDYIMPFVRLATYYREKKNNGKAIDFLNEAVSRASVQYLEIHARKLLAETLFEAGRLGESEAEYYKVRELTGNHHFFSPLVDLGEKYLEKGNVSEAIRHLQQALEDNPANAKAREVLARCFEIERRAGEAIALLDSLLEGQPENADFLRQSAWLRATSPEQSDHDAPLAVNQARLAIALDGSSDPRSWTVLAAAQADNHEFEQAIESIDKAIALYERMHNAPAAAEARRFRDGFVQGLSIRLPPPQPR